MKVFIIKTRSIEKGALPALFGISMGVTLSAQGAGFQLLEQSVTGLGRSFAGGSLAADDASAAFYNPADMLLPGQRSLVQAGAIYLSVENRFEGTYSFPAPVAVHERAKTESIVPHLHVIHSLDDRSSVGFSISVPFGLLTEYNDSWAGQYETVRSEIITTDINPSFAYRISDQWYAGVGLSWQHAEATLKQNIFSQTFAGAPFFLSSATDGRATINGDDGSWGYNAGLTWLPDDEQRFSLTYRSSMKHELEGKRTFAGLTGPAAVLNGIEKGSADLTLPEIITFNAWQKLDERMAAMFSLRHTRWSRYEELRVTYDNPLWPDTVEAQNWHNTWSASFGVDYQFNEMLKLRSGIGYDETPVPGSTYYSPRLPTIYTVWLSAGLSWQLSRTLTLDAAYMYVEGKNADINYTGTLGNLTGEFQDTRAQEVGVQLQYRF